MDDIFSALLAQPRECGFYEIPILISCLEECVSATTPSQFFRNQIEIDSTCGKKISLKLTITFQMLLEDEKDQGLLNLSSKYCSKSPFFVKHMGLMDQFSIFLKKWM